MALKTILNYSPNFNPKKRTQASGGLERGRQRRLFVRHGTQCGEWFRN